MKVQTISDEGVASGWDWNRFRYYTICLFFSPSLIQSRARRNEGLRMEIRHGHNDTDKPTAEYLIGPIRSI